MRSVRHLKGEIFGIVLCAVLVISIYVGFVGFVNELFGHDFIEAISLSSLLRSTDSYRFAMGDTIIVSAKVKQSNAYRLDVYDNSDHVVFEDAGGVNGSDITVPVPIRPSAFNASRVYKLAFQAGLVNYPLLGIGTYDYAGGPFAVVKSPTRLGLTANYNAVSHELQAVASLTTNDTVPVENRTVSLCMQPDMDLPLNGKGWVCLGSSQTDENGTASFDVAVNVRGGAYGLEARFAGDDDFGASKSMNATSFVAVSPVPCLRVVKIEKVKGTVNLVLRVTDRYDFPLGGRLLSFEPLNLGGDPLYAISNETGYASVTLNLGGLLSFVDSRISVLGDVYTSRLQTRAILNLTGSTPFFEGVSGAGTSESLLSSGGSADSVNPEKASTSGFAVVMSYLPMSVSLNQNPAVADLPETVSVYFATATYPGWVQFQFYRNGTSNVGNVGSSCRKHRMPDGEGGYLYWWEYSGSLVWQPDYYGGCSLTVNAVDSSGTIIAQGSSGSFSISPAPVNLVVYYPLTFCGSALDISVALSRSRVYQQATSGFFQSYTLAPNRQWVGNTYMLDCGDNSTLIEVYVNGSRSVVVPDSQGFARVQVNLGSLGNGGALNVTGHINATSRFKEVLVNRSFTFSQTSVSDVPSAGSGSFALNYSLRISDGGERAYIDVQNSVDVGASLYGFPVYNASASVITAMLNGRNATNSSGWATIPSGCNYLRVKSACKLTQDMVSPLADAYRDGNINMDDYNLVSTKYGSRLGDSRFDWRSDLNGDGQIDNADLDIVNITSNFGKHLTYLSGYNYSAAEVDFDTGQKVHLDSQGFASVPSGAQWLNMSIGGIVEFFTASTTQNISTDNLGLGGAGWCQASVGLDVVQVKMPSTFNVIWSCNPPPSVNVNASLNVASYYYVLKRPVDFNINVQANVSYVPGGSGFSGSIYASALDHVTQQQVADLPVQFLVNSQCPAYYTTNQSEMAQETWLFTNIVYNITVSCADCGDNAASVGSSFFDFRQPTNITSQPCNSVADASFLKHLYFDLTDNFSDPLGGDSVDLYINGTYYNGSSPQVYANHINNTTLSNGTVAFDWQVPGGNGTYGVIAVFNGNANYCPCQVCDTVTVKSVPLGVLFSVTPTEFKPGDSVLLNATVIDDSTGNLFTGQNVTVNFTRVSSAGSGLVVGSNSTNFTGMATLPLNYPTDGNAYAYKAEVVPDYAGGSLRQGVASSPVQLTVANPTVLLLNVSRDNSSTAHLVEGWLMSNGAGVKDKTVTTTVNGESFQNTTDKYGYFNVSLDLQPESPNGQPAYQNVTYTITASFAGDTALNATAYSNTLDGTSYAACTTVQYGYKPSSNSTVLTVNPQSSQAAVPTKTPEQMQQDAQNSGWLRVVPGFSWSYPWFRMHYKLDVNLPQGNPKLDYGWSPLPFGESTNANNTALANTMNTVTEGSDPTALAMFFGAVAVPFITQAIVAYTVGQTVAGIAVAAVVYGTFLALFTAMTYARAEGNPNAWLMGFMSVAFVEMAALFIPVSGVVGVANLLTTAARWVLGEIECPLQALHALKMGFFAITGAIFVLMDFVVMAFLLSMYLNSI